MSSFALVLLLVLLPAVAHAYEEPRSEVVARHPGFEVRRYTPQLVAETSVRGPFGEARREAFMRLFRYISGANRAREKIAMTVPVTTTAAEGEKIAMTVPVTTTSAEGGQVMRFVVPSSFTAATVPEPTDPQVRIVEVPEHWVAALGYSGRSTESNYREQEAKLLSLLREAGLEPVGAPWFAVYNGPFTPWFLRRNEVLVPVGRP
jgi:hypothetical protein